MPSRLPPIGWGCINLTGDYVCSDRLNLGADGIMLLLAIPYRKSVSD